MLRHFLVGFIRVRSGSYAGQCFFRTGTISSIVRTPSDSRDSRDCSIPSDQAVRLVGPRIAPVLAPLPQGGSHDPALATLLKAGCDGPPDEAAYPIRAGPNIEMDASGNMGKGFVTVMSDAGYQAVRRVMLFAPAAAAARADAFKWSAPTLDAKLSGGSQLLGKLSHQEPIDSAPAVAIIHRAYVDGWGNVRDGNRCFYQKGCRPQAPMLRFPREGVTNYPKTLCSPVSISGQGSGTHLAKPCGVPPRQPICCWPTKPS